MCCQSLWLFNSNIHPGKLNHDACLFRTTRRVLAAYQGCGATSRGITRSSAAIKPSPHSGEGSNYRQLSLRFAIGASKVAISAVCAALPLKVSTLPALEMATWSPSSTAPARIISASGSCRLR